MTRSAPLNRHALRAIRQRSGFTVSALADLSGVSQPHLSNIEAGRRRASPEAVAALAAALSVPLPALLGGAEDDDTDVS